MAFESKPRAFSCYLCGAQFGSHSLLIHVRACQKKWAKEEEGKPVKARRSPPAPPPELADPADPSRLASSAKDVRLPTSGPDIDAFNARSLSTWNSASLQGCPHCGRTFTAEPFARHQKVCSAEAPFKQSTALSGGAIKATSSANRSDSRNTSGSNPTTTHSINSPPSTVAAATDGHLEEGGGVAGKTPRSYTCYLCGRGFMGRSLGIHLPQCLSKWIAGETLREPGKQRKPPLPPPELADPDDPTRIRAFKDGVAEGVLPKRPADIEAFNKRMGDFWSQASLAACGKCGRTFNWEALEKHEKGCKGGEATRASGGEEVPMQKLSVTSSATATKNEHVPIGSSSPGPRSYVCFLCGRGFMSRSLGIHLPQCLAKWDAEMSRRPPHLRRGTPPPPPELSDPAVPTQLRPFKDGIAEGVLPKKSADIEAFNRRMTAAWEEGSLVRCAACNRTFNWEALEKHEKGCKGK